VSEGQEYFAKVASQWDALRSTFFSNEVSLAVIRQARVDATSVVVNVGTGTGFLAAAFAPLVGRVFGVDLSVEMLAVAAENLRAFPNVEWRLSDGLSLPLESETADAEVANMYLHHVPEPVEAIREMARVVRPGGRVVLTDLDLHDHEWLRREHADHWLGFARADVHRGFEEAGLVEVVVGCVGSNCCATSTKGEKAAISIFIASGHRPGRG
jgi:ubiquinone/menaquinone biosynthesis C-methylase UbiE